METSLDRDSSRVRYLDAARALGSAGLSCLALFSLAPESVFGGAGELRWPGWVAAAVEFGALCTIGFFWLRRAGFVRGMLTGLFGFNLCLFLPALSDDPLLAGAAMVWNLFLLIRHLLRESTAPPESEAGSEADAHIERVAPALIHLALVCLAAALVGLGFRPHSGLGGMLILLGLNLAALPFSLLRQWRSFRAGHASALLGPALVVLAATLSFFQAPALALLCLSLSQLVTLGLLLIEQPVARGIFESFLKRPVLLAALSFAFLILLGALLLSFPVSARGDRPLLAIDALFTATSAVCVTGLSTIDVATALSPFGQGVLLFLIQVGGLGILVFSTFATLLLGGHPGLRVGQALSQSLELRGAKDAYRLAGFIGIFTFGIEALGALALGLVFARHGADAADAAWQGVFHSVSAFCNAGFALFSDNLVMLQRDPWGLLVISLLVVLGGIGFLVLAALASSLRRGAARHLSLHVKVVLVWTGALVAGGTLVFLLLEWNGVLQGLSLGDKLSNALLLSVSPRTAGFNALPVDGLRSASLLVIMLFMFVGASPGSAAGGIKTTTLAVLLGAVRASIRGDERVVLFGRQVPQDVVYRAVAISVLHLGISLVGLWGLLLTQPHAPAALAFETVSATGTVGLTLSVTPTLTASGKLLVVFLMFAGRVGPMSLALLLGRAREVRTLYPESRLMVG